MVNKAVDILVVDDEQVMRSLLTDVLEDKGFKVRTANNGKDAIEIVKEASFDVVFMDVHMPIMDGIETLRAIKKTNPAIEVVMMDSYPDDQMLRPEASQMVSCITKPFNIRQITDIVDAILSKKGISA